MTIDPQWEAYTVRRTYEPGEYIFQEGDPAREMYIILSGQVAVLKHTTDDTPIVLSYRGAGDLIGEVALLQEGRRTASALAIDKTVMLTIICDEFWALFDQQPVFRTMVLRTLVDRLLAADESRVRAAVTERQTLERLSSLSTEHERMAELLQLRQDTVRFIVHDLRNPLGLMMMALQIIEQDPAYQPDAESRRLLAMATGAVRRMFALVESLLDVERLEDGIAALTLHPVDMRALVDDVVERAQPMAWGTNVTLSTEHKDSTCPPVIGDRVRLDRVITNLVDNALKFTPPEKSVTISTWCVAGEVFVAVEDSGPGIPPERRHRIFDRFARADARDQGSRGFGLGLAYCRSAVTAHGGRIWVEESTRLGGARFVIALPFSPGAQAE